MISSGSFKVQPEPIQKLKAQHFKTCPRQTDDIEPIKPSMFIGMWSFHALLSIPSLKVEVHVCKIWHSPFAPPSWMAFAGLVWGIEEGVARKKDPKAEIPVGPI